MRNNATDRAAAIRWARQMMQQDFVVLDTETTGLDDRAEIVSIAVVAKNGRVLLDALVQPTQPIPSRRRPPPCTASPTMT